MREIKFRVWDTESKSFVVRLLPSAIDRTINNVLFNILDFFKCPGYIFQQYTNLKDSNGTEIYEGDILYTSNDTLRAVVWSESECKFVAQLDNKDIYAFSVSPWLNKNYPDLEVKGNIFENPDLIK